MDFDRRQTAAQNPNFPPTAKAAPVVIYDITTDSERPAEQGDIDEMQRALAAYQTFRRAIKQLDKLMTNVGLGSMSQKDFRNVTDRLFKEADDGKKD